MHRDKKFFYHFGIQRKAERKKAQTTLIIKHLHKHNSPQPVAIITVFDKLLKVKLLLLLGETQEKKDLFIPNKIANFAIVEVLLN